MKKDKPRVVSLNTVDTTNKPNTEDTALSDYTKTRRDFRFYHNRYVNYPLDETDLDILNGRYGTDSQLLNDYFQYLELANSIINKKNESCNKTLSELIPLTVEKTGKIDKIIEENDAKMKALDHRYPNINNKVATVSFEQLKKDKEFQEDEAYCKKMWDTKNGFEMMEGVYDRIQKWWNRGFSLMHNISGENGQWLEPCFDHDAEYLGSYFDRLQGEWKDVLIVKRKLTIPELSKAIRQEQKYMRKEHPQPRSPYGFKKTGVPNVSPVILRAKEIKSQCPNLSWRKISIIIGSEDNRIPQSVEQDLYRARKKGLLP